MIVPRPEVARLTPYQPGRPAGFRLGANVVNLASNENAWGPSPEVADALRGVDPARYPDMAGQDLVEALATHWRVQPDQLLLGTGSGHLIKCLAEAYVRPGDAVVIATPTFSLYRQAAELMGGRVEVLAGDGRRIAFERLPALVAAIRPRLLFLCSPNNPTGDAAPPRVVAELLDAVMPDGLAVVDEAYVDFSDQPDGALAHLRAGASVAVLRTFSKVYGLAALRLGVLVAPPPIIDAVGRVREPFPVTGPTFAAARAALLDSRHWDYVRQEVARGRQRLTAALRQRQWAVEPSQANFVWARPPGALAGDSADALVVALRAKGILIRSGTPFGVPSHVRITIGTSTELDHLLRALDRLPGEEA